VEGGVKTRGPSAIKGDSENRRKREADKLQDTSTLEAKHSKVRGRGKGIPGGGPRANREGGPKPFFKSRRKRKTRRISED